MLMNSCMYTKITKAVFFQYIELKKTGPRSVQEIAKSKKTSKILKHIISRYLALLTRTNTSKYGLFDTNGNNYLDSYDDFVDGYTVIDFAINKRFFNDYTLGFGVDNLFNFTDTQNISNIAGRIIYGKLNIQF